MAGMLSRRGLFGLVAGLPLVGSLLPKLRSVAVQNAVTSSVGPFTRAVVRPTNYRDMILCLQPNTRAPLHDLAVAADVCEIEDEPFLFRDPHLPASRLPA